MKNRKEYNDRVNAPLVNPGFTLEEYELERIKSRFKQEVETNCLHTDIKMTQKFESENLECHCGFKLPF